MDQDIIKQEMNSVRKEISNRKAYQQIDWYKVVTTVCIVLFALQASALNLYVAVNGNDLWSGKLSSPNAAKTDGPFATISAARNAVRNFKKKGGLNEDITIFIKEGTYPLTETIKFGPEDSGDKYFSVKYVGTGKGATFIGGIQVSNFKNEDGLWVADLGKELAAKHHFEQMYVNGSRATRAKTPNNGFYSPKNVVETTLEKGGERVAAKAEQRIYLGGQNSDWIKDVKPSETDRVVLTFYHKWDNTRKYLADLSLKDTTLTIKGKGMKSWNPLNKKTLFFAENYRAALDTAGEWFLDLSGKLYYKPLKGQDINNAVVYLPILEQLLIIGGNPAKPVTNISFKNLGFKVSAYSLPLLGEEPTQVAAPTPAAIMIDFGQEIDFSDCEIANTGANAIWFRNGCSKSSISHGFLNDLGAGGVKIGTTSISPNTTREITVDNCILKSGGYVFPCAAGIAIFNAAQNTIRHNDISDFRYSGISVGWVWGYKDSPAVGNVIEYNHIHHLGWGELSDMGGIYTLGRSPGTVIRNNVIHHIYSYTYGGWGIYTDEGSSNILIENNLVYQTKSSGFHQHYGRENVIKNNIFAFGKQAQVQLSKAEDHLSFTLTNNIIYYSQGGLLIDNANQSLLKGIIKVDSNLYWNAAKQPILFPGGESGQWKAKGNDLHSIIADPGFENAEKYDFNIKNRKVISPIHFKTFDYRKAGVYGNKTWKSKARTPESVQQAFEKLLSNQNMKFVD